MNKTDVTEGDTVLITCSAKEETGKQFFQINDDSGTPILIQEAIKGELQMRHTFTSAGMTNLFCSYDIFTLQESLKSNISNMVTVSVKSKQIILFIYYVHYSDCRDDVDEFSVQSFSYRTVFTLSTWV